MKFRALLLAVALLSAAEKPVKDRALDLELQLVSQQLETLQAMIAPIEREKAKHQARLNKLITQACEAAKIQRARCQARIEDGHVVLSESEPPAPTPAAAASEPKK